MLIGHRSIGYVHVGPESEGSQTDPTSGTVMADSGVVTATGLYEVRLGMGGSAAGQFSVQRRNTANDGNTGDVVIKWTAASGSAEYVYLYKLLENERIRVVATANLTGTYACDLQLWQVG